MANDSREHYKDDLSAYLDEALSTDQKERIAVHLPKCDDCRTELDELKNITKLVGALPDHDLPSGFLTRLKMKRGEAEREAYAPLGWLSQPKRIAAFAATGLFAGFVFFNEVRYRFAPQMLDMDGAAMSMSQSEAMSAEDITLARRELVAQNNKSAAEWDSEESEDDFDASAPQESSVVLDTAKLLERSAGSVAAVRGAAGRAAPKLKARKRSKAAGSPVGQPSYTNNELRSFLAKEQDRLGIKQIVPNAPRSNDPWEGIPDRPMSKDEAQAAMRRVTRRITEVNRGARAANRPAISLEGLTPSLLGSQATSKPLGLASAARRQRGSAMTSRMDIVSVPGSKAVVLKDHAETFLEEGQKMDKVQGKREYTEAEGRKFAKSQQEIKNRRGYAYASPKPIPVKDMKKEQGLEDMSGLSPMPLGRSWGDETGGLGTAGGAVLTDPKDFADLWDRLGRTEAMPSVDFEKEMVIAVFAQRSDSRRHIEIVSVAKQGGRIVIRYRVTPVANRKGPSAPYHVVTVERSAYPFSFVQVP